MCDGGAIVGVVVQHSSLKGNIGKTGREALWKGEGGNIEGDLA